MSKAIPGTVAGWLDPRGVCYYAPDTHTDWAAKYLKLAWSSKVSDKELVNGLKIDKILYDRGWSRIIIDPVKDVLYFDTLNVPWKNLTSLQRRWLYNVSMNGYNISGDKILPGSIFRKFPMKLQFGYTGRNPEPEDLVESKISFYGMLRKVLTEKMSFRDLLRTSDPVRISRGKHEVRARSIKVISEDNQELWTFNYKSNPSTTGNRWHGYVRFFKEDVSQADNAEDLYCQVDCDCPDFRYRWAYNNSRADVTPVGSDSINGNNGHPPRNPNNDLGVGMCKHLCSLAEFLKTKIEPVAPEPDELPEPTQKIKIKSKPYLGTTSIAAPNPDDPPPPDDSYSDSRSGSDTLQENHNNHLYEKIDRFVKNNPQFEVWYEG